MARRHRLQTRSTGEWMVRGILAAIVAVLGAVVVTNALAAIVHSRDPAQAHRLAPYNGRWSALFASTLSSGEVGPDERRQADVLARTALRRDATAVQAASALGISAQVRGDIAGARRLFAYAEWLSRRDLTTQLWAIEDSVARGDVPATLRHYDIALRISRTAPDLLFPVLATAISDVSVRRSLLLTLSHRPGWATAFTDYVAGNGPDPRATAQLFRGMARIGLPISEQGQATLLGRLLTTDAVGDAWTHYAALRHGVDRRMSRDPAFTATLSVPTAFDWVPLSEGGVVSSLQPAARGGTFDFSAPTSVGGPVLQQLQFLPPGNYRLDGRVSGISQAADTLPYWQLGCLNGRELGRVTLTNAGEDGKGFHGAFSVPVDCPVQMLVLVIKPSDAIEGSAGRINGVQLRPR